MELKQRRQRRQRKGQKNAIGCIGKTSKFARVSRFFCTFLSRRCTTTTWRCLISRFVEDGEHKATTFLFFCWTLIQSFRIQKLPTFDVLNEMEWDDKWDGITLVYIYGGSIDLIPWWEYLEEKSGISGIYFKFSASGSKLFGIKRNNHAIFLASLSVSQQQRMHSQNKINRRHQFSVKIFINYFQSLCW